MLSWVISIGLAAAAQNERVVPANSLRVPDSFSVHLAAAQPEIRFPMFATFDDHGRLYVAESSGLDLYSELKAQTRKCQIRALEDSDGDGYYERSWVFADRLVFPMGLVWRAGKLYVADPPDLVTLEDTDNDGRADQRQIILTGFGHTDNGSLHGLIFGPDGWLYMTMGEPDGYRLVRRDGSILEGTSGALIRCRPDGSGVEVVSRGFENLVEVVFLPNGEIIGTDNWFQRPVGGLRDALVHLVQGGLYPYAPDSGTPHLVSGEPLPPITLLPAVAISGLTVCRSPQFPESYRGTLFSAQHNTRSVMRHTLKRAGSTFRSDDSEFLTTDDPDFHPSDVLEDADGSLLVLDTGSWYIHHCPTGRIRNSPATGGIYRIRSRNSERLDDPWGAQIAWPKSRASELVRWLRDSRPAVRDKAELELSNRGDPAVPELQSLLQTPTDGATDLIAKSHAVWALVRMTNTSAMSALHSIVRSREPDIASAAMRHFELHPTPSARSNLEGQLFSDFPQVRVAAAFALARCGMADSLPIIWRRLAADPDRFFEHALIYAAHHLATTEPLSLATQHPSPRVRRAALLLLDQPPRPHDALKPEMLIASMAAADPALRRTAVNLLRKRPEWSDFAADYARARLARDAGAQDEERLLRDLISSFDTAPAMQKLVASALADTRIGTRVWLIELVAQSSNPTLPHEWISGLERCLAHPDPNVQWHAARAAAVRQAGTLDSLLLKLAGDSEKSTDLRLEAIRGIRNQALPQTLIDFLIECLTHANPLTRLTAMERLKQRQLNAQQLGRVLANNEALPTLKPILMTFNGHGSPTELEALLRRIEHLIHSGWLPSQNEFTQFCERLPAPYRNRLIPLTPKLQDPSEGQREKLERFAALTTGGNPISGRKIFYGPKALCSACHDISNTGGRVGPDLTRIGTVRSSADLLESILIPSATFAQGYESYHMITRRGEEHSGVLVDRANDAVVLRDASGADHRVPQNEIASLRRLERSLMPDQLESALTPEEFRDLFAFLKELK